MRDQLALVLWRAFSFSWTWNLDETRAVNNRKDTHPWLASRRAFSSRPFLGRALRKLCCQAGESGESKAFKSSFTLLVVALLVFGRPKSPASICAFCVALLVHQLPTKVWINNLVSWLSPKEFKDSPKVLQQTHKYDKTVCGMNSPQKYLDLTYTCMLNHMLKSPWDKLYS